MDSINKIIQIARLRRDIKQVDLAKMIGIDSSRLSDIETGKKSPTWDEIEKISIATNYKVFELLPQSVLQEYLITIAENKIGISSNRQEILKLWTAIRHISNELNLDK